MKHHFALAVAIAFFGSPGWATECSPLELDAVPAQILWRVDGVVTARAAGDSLIVQTHDELRMVQTESGEVIWTYSISPALRAPDYVVLDRRVVVVRDDQYLDFLDRSTGEVRATRYIDDWIQFLVGPPLVAVSSESENHSSTLLHITPEGAIVSAVGVDLVSDILVLNGVAVVEIESAFIGVDDVLSGYRIDSLEHLWSVEGDTFNTQVIDGRLYFGNIAWEDGAQPIDALTGELGRRVPPRAPFKIGGSRAFDIQVTDTVQEGRWNPHFAACQRLRRNDIATGKPKWSVDLPFGIHEIKGLLRDGETLYVAGSRNSQKRFLVALDWESGSVVRAWSGTPFFWALEKVDDVVFGYDHSGELAAVRVGRRGAR